MQLCGFGEPSNTPPGKRLDLENDVYAQRTPREIQFLRKSNLPAPAVFEIPLPIPGEISLPELGLALMTRVKPDKEKPAAAVIRSVRPGDRITPRHTRSPKKIKEVLERLHLSAAERAQLPLVAWEGHILWLRGVELDPASLPELPFTLEVTALR